MAERVILTIGTRKGGLHLIEVGKDRDPEPRGRAIPATCIEIHRPHRFNAGEAGERGEMKGVAGV